MYHWNLEWDVELDEKLSVAGEIRVNTGIRDYKEIGEPVVVFGNQNSKASSLPGAFCCPSGVAIIAENSSIYICDGGNNVYRFIFSLYSNSTKI